MDVTLEWQLVNYTLIWSCSAKLLSQVSQWISILVGHRRGTKMAWRKVDQDAFFKRWVHWLRYLWFQRMKNNRNTKVLKLQYSDNGGVMTKIIGNHTGDHNIQLLKLNINVRSIREEFLLFVMLLTAGLLHMLLPCKKENSLK